MRGSVVAVGVIAVLIGLGLGGYGSVSRSQSIVVPEPVSVSKSTEWQIEWLTFTPEGVWGAPVGSGTFPSTFNFDWDDGKLHGPYSDWVGFRATATVKAPRNGPVTLTLGSDDGSQLHIDGREVISLWSDHYYSTRSVVEDMTQGSHQLVLSYYEKTGQAQVSFSAPADILTWEETEYRIVTRQVTQVDTSLQTLGAILATGGLLMSCAGVVLRRRPTRGTP